MKLATAEEEVSGEDPIYHQKSVQSSCQDWDYLYLAWCCLNIFTTYTLDPTASDSWLAMLRPSLRVRLQCEMVCSGKPPTMLRGMLFFSFFLVSNLESGTGPR